MAVSTENQLINKIALDVIEISKISIGDTLIYSAGNTVTYHVDDEITHQEEVDADETVLSPKTFIPEKVGWEFVGWKSGETADDNVLKELNMDDEPIVLYCMLYFGRILLCLITETAGQDPQQRKQSKDIIITAILQIQHLL